MFTSRCGPYVVLAMKSATSWALSASSAGLAGMGVFHGLAALNGRHAAGGALVTWTVAWALTLGSAWLVAVTWQVPVAAGAV